MQHLLLLCTRKFWADLKRALRAAVMQLSTCSCDPVPYEDHPVVERLGASDLTAAQNTGVRLKIARSGFCLRLALA